mmetsp:Transcript_24052/g.48034  ORF Transcript_24052/g.48034 Transcript_24052/m.48034 type:complete len:291 (-) Transcript_24052:54-926(-)
MITVSDNDNGVENFVPVLIDFSLAKFISGPNAVLPPGCTHTGEIGTPTYTAPEVVSRENYGIKSDLWSVGVVLLETLIGELTVDRDKAAARLIEENKASLPESPFVNLIRGLLEQDVDKRLSAREALAMPIFEKFGFEMPPVRSIDLETALTYVGEYSENDEVRNSSKINQKKSSKPQKLSPRERLIKNLCNELECKNPKTEIAAGYYAKVMEQLDDELDDINNSQTLLDCVLAASRFYEEELICLEELQQDDGEYFPSFKNFCLDTFRDNESALLMSLDYSMYLVKQSR